MADQSITLAGNAVAAAELRFTATGRAVAALTVAVNHRFRNPEGEWVDADPLFQQCAIWGDLAEHVAESVSKGDRVVVTGRLVSRSYEDREGQTRYVTDLVCDEVAVSLRFATAKVTRIRRDGASAATADAWVGSVDATSGVDAEPVLTGAGAPF